MGLYMRLLPFMWLCVVAAGLLGNIRITKKAHVDEKGNRDFSENVTESAYLLSLLRRRLGKRRGKVVPHLEKPKGNVGATPKAEMSVAGKEMV